MTYSYHGSKTATLAFSCQSFHESGKIGLLSAYGLECSDAQVAAHEATCCEKVTSEPSPRRLASPRNTILGIPDYTVFANCTSRGTVTANRMSLGAFTTVPGYVAFQGVQLFTENAFSPIMSFASKHLQFDNDSGSVDLSFPSGAGGIGTSPFFLSFLDLSRPLNPTDPLYWTLTGSRLLTMKFTYMQGAIRYNLAASDIDPFTGGSINVTISGAVSRDKDTGVLSDSNSMVLKTSTALITAKSSAANQYTPPPVPVPVPQPVPAPLPVTVAPIITTMKGMKMKMG
jgi:hypothetical protein